MGITAFKKYSVNVVNHQTGVSEVVEMEALDEGHLLEEVNDCLPDFEIVSYNQITGVGHDGI